MTNFDENDASGSTGQQEDSLRHAAEMQKASVRPYVFFGGRCEEAIEFYEKALGAKVEMKMRFSESPEPLPEGTIQAGFEDKIMHATLTIGAVSIMVSDGWNDKTTINGFRLALTVANQVTAETAFQSLAEHGVVDLPLGKTFWSPCYGMVTDPFGVGWMVMVAGDPA